MARRILLPGSVRRVGYLEMEPADELCIYRTTHVHVPRQPTPRHISDDSCLLPPMLQPFIWCLRPRKCILYHRQIRYASSTCISSRLREPKLLAREGHIGSYSEGAESGVGSCVPGSMVRPMYLGFDVFFAHSKSAPEREGSTGRHRRAFEVELEGLDEY
jgi:hypothetical protein